MENKTYDLIVIGGGSGGMGAAITAGREGLKTLWIEKENLLGGTGVNAWVNVWQPAYSVSRLAAEIFERLDGCGGACFNKGSKGMSYKDTLRRWEDGEEGKNAPGIVYVPEIMHSVLLEMAKETGNIDILTDTVFLDCHTVSSIEGMKKISSLEIQTLNGRETVSAACFIDATADIYLARSAGCEWSLGREPSAKYHEPSAPGKREFKLNGVTLIFKVRQGGDLIFRDKVSGPDGSGACVDKMPNGDLIINLCFQIEGEVALMMGTEKTREYLTGNIFKRWPQVRKHYGLEEYGIVEIAPRIGVREGPRLVGKYVLTENDIRQGRFGKHHDDCISFCDHPMDRHYPGEGWVKLENGPFGVPFRCLQPQEIDNLLVAGRGAGFTSLAASACRLQRTMIELGEAAAYYFASGTIIKPERPPYSGGRKAKEIKIKRKIFNQ